MADTVQEFEISYRSKPPFSDVSACTRHTDCPRAKYCLRAVVFNQQGWFGSWIEPKTIGNECELIITEKKVAPKPQIKQQPQFKFRG